METPPEDKNHSNETDVPTASDYETNSWRHVAAEKIGALAIATATKAHLRLRLARHRVATGAAIASDLIGTTGHRAKENVGYAADATRLSLAGIRKAGLERRAQEAREKNSRLSLSAEVHQVASQHVLNLGRSRHPDKETEERITRSEEIAAAAYARSRRPVTWAERRQARRQYKRKHRNMREAIENRNIEQRYGKDFGPVDSAASSARLTRGEERATNRALRRYQDNSDLMKIRTNRIERSAAGEDIPGKVLRSRANRNARRAERLAARADRLGEREEELRAKLAARRSRNGPAEAPEGDEPPTEPTLDQDVASPRPDTELRRYENSEEVVEPETPQLKADSVIELAKAGVKLAISAAIKSGGVDSQRVWERYKNDEPVDVDDALGAAKTVGIDPIALANLLAKIPASRTEQTKARIILKYSAARLAQLERSLEAGEPNE